MSVLDRIFASKRDEVAAAKYLTPERELETRIESKNQPQDFVESLRDESRPRPRLIAEIKRRSPSKGLLCQDFNPTQLGRIYAQNGAAAISVLTDEKFFGGSLKYLGEITNLNLGVPILRKDFIFDRYQLLEARAYGASAVLLIVAMLSGAALAELISQSYELTLTPFVEIHDHLELDKALGTGANVIGINNRDLNTFSVDLNTTLELIPHIPPEITIVSESGIRSLEDVKRLSVSGVQAMLIGESIVKADDVAKQVRLLSRVDAEFSRD